MSDVNVTIKTFGYPATELKEYAHWVVLLRPKQITLGTVVIANKSGALHLGELSSEEWAEFSEVVSDVERVQRELFDAKKFNFLALMMKDPNVHFHAVPRYDTDVTFEGQVFHDPDWPYKTELTPIEIPDEVFQKLYTKMREAFV